MEERINSLCFDAGCQDACRGPEDTVKCEVIRVLEAHDTRTIRVTYAKTTALQNKTAKIKFHQKIKKSNKIYAKR